MDPELLQLFSQAIRGNKNVAGTMGNLDNIMLGFLSGGFNPYTVAPQTQQGGSLWSSYAGNPEYEEIQPIIDLIQRGADEFQIQQAVDNMVADGGSLGSFSADNFGRLARALQEDYSKGGPKAMKDVFRQAGLSSPLDLYDVSTVPLGAKTKNRIAELEDERLRLAESRTGVDQNLNAAFNALKKSKTSKGESAVQRFYSGKDLAKMVRRQGTDYNPIFGRLGGKAKEFAKWLETQDSISVERVMQEADMMFEGVGPKGFPESKRVVEQGLGRKDRLGRLNRTEEIVEGTPEFYAFRRAIDASRRQTSKEQEIDAREKALRSGALRAAQEQGRTPLGDELKQRMRLLAGLGK
jgi:hypothetical protein